MFELRLWTLHFTADTSMPKHSVCSSTTHSALSIRMLHCVFESRHTGLFSISLAKHLFHIYQHQPKIYDSTTPLHLFQPKQQANATFTTPIGSKECELHSQTWKQDPERTGRRPYSHEGCSRTVLKAISAVITRTKTLAHDKPTR